MVKEDMKRFALRFFSVLLTFIIGVAIATSWRLRPNVYPVPHKPVLPQNQERKEASISAWQVLLSFEDQDLSRLERSSAVRLRQALNVLIGKPRPDEFPLVPRLISKMSNAQGQTDYALIEEAPLLKIPGESRLHVHLFTIEGNLLGSSEFSSGWRISLDGMQVKYMPEVGREVLEVSSRPNMNGRDVVKQYYALIGEKVMLIRLEDSHRHLTRNLYGAGLHPIGLTIKGRSAEEWEKALESDDLVEALATTVWLGGTRWNTQRPMPDSAGEEGEDMSEARLAEDVRSREGVQATLSRLVQSDNVWVRRAAELAVKVEYYNK
jgi:hypothetical protein